VAPLQAAALVAEHWPHDPEGWQAGADPPHSLSPAQARQVCVAVLQTGLDPPHSPSVRHATQMPAAAWQTGVAPVHAAALVAEH